MKIFYYNKQTKSLIIMFKACKYIEIHLCLKRWCLGVQKFRWANGNIEWFIWVLCFMVSLNNYGAIVRDKDWSWEL